MHVFVAGATGSIGGALSLRLLEEGHAVSGLARTPAKAAELSAIGMAPVHGSLDDLSVIAEAARKPRRAGRPLMRRSRGPPRVRVTGSPPHRCQEAGAVLARLLFSFIAMPPNPPRAADGSHDRRRHGGHPQAVVTRRCSPRNMPVAMT